MKNLEKFDLILHELKKVVKLASDAKETGDITVRISLHQGGIHDQFRITLEKLDKISTIDLTN